MRSGVYINFNLVLRDLNFFNDKLEFCYGELKDV